MELRHLRYLVAVAGAGSLTVAAEQTLHTSQPSLSRQIRDLEDEVGARLLTRRARGIELTPAGRAFLELARVVLSQVEAAAEAVRRGLRVVIDTYLSSTESISRRNMSGPQRHSNVPNSIDAWRGAVARLRAELSALVCDESSSE